MNFIEGIKSEKKLIKRLLKKLREVVSVEIQAKAIELIRSGEIKNPNDLVLKLGIPLDVAENPFERILSNEKIIASSVTKVVDKQIRISEIILSHVVFYKDLLYIIAVYRLWKCFNSFSFYSV
jgi:hypothetical protein